VLHFQDANVNEKNIRLPLTSLSKMRVGQLCNIKRKSKQILMISGHNRKSKTLSNMKTSGMRSPINNITAVTERQLPTCLSSSNNKCNNNLRCTATITSARSATATRLVSPTAASTSTSATQAPPPVHKHLLPAPELPPEKEEEFDSDPYMPKKQRLDPEQVAPGPQPDQQAQQHEEELPRTYEVHPEDFLTGRGPDAGLGPAF
jgi:hypothetical protein